MYTRIVFIPLAVLLSSPMLNAEANTSRKIGRRLPLVECNRVVNLEVPKRDLGRVINKEIGKCVVGILALGKLKSFGQSVKRTAGEREDC